jgi:lipid A ethanolaminephosphotransferase
MKYIPTFRPLTASQLIVVVSVFLILFDNTTFFSQFLDIYPLSLKNFVYLLSVATFFTAGFIMLLSVVTFSYLLKPVLIVIVITASVAAYFMDSYNTVIDTGMIENVLSTNLSETADLLSLKWGLYVILLGLVPAFLIYKTPITQTGFRKSIISRIALFVSSIVIIVIMVLSFSSFYASFFREHKPLRYYINPATAIYSLIKHVSTEISSARIPMHSLGLDAKISTNDLDRELIIFVVGETARADRFSLNGYARKTNPLLSQEQVVSFTNVWSCGTSTAVSVPCMFSIYDTDNYNKQEAMATENILDVLQHAGVNVLWLDNNSDSKGVALRSDFKDFRQPEINTECDIECRDVGMLTGLQKYIDSHKQGDIFIVLHSMGNHGPAYYKRYPAKFEKFKPACKTNQLEDCTREEIDNAYDNAILYTDYFLSKVIALLKKNEQDYETAMIYVSDHGESLGEHNLYLHGMPNMLAPEAQRHVPGIMWIGSHFDEIDLNALQLKKDNKYTHDNIFHTLLGIFEVNTSVYDPKLDMINNQ